MGFGVEGVGRYGVGTGWRLVDGLEHRQGLVPLLLLRVPQLGAQDAAQKHAPLAHAPGKATGEAGRRGSELEALAYLVARHPALWFGVWV